MLKLMFCLRRLPSFTAEGFREYWLNKHAPLVRSVAHTLKIRRYVQCHTLGDPRLAASVAARGATVEPYDGVAELWWDSFEDFVSAGATSESRAAGRQLLEDERRFIDLANSPLFCVDVREIITVASSP
jgi:uncharacterized protein (TIGR02118 family)